MPDRFMRHALAALACAALLAPAAGADVVTDWDRIACDAVGVAKSATPAGVRALAIAQTAVFEAVNQITGRYPVVGRELATNSRYPAAGPKPLSNASVEAAVASANRAALARLLPGAKEAVEAAYQKAIAAIPEGDAKLAGIAIGERAAADVIMRKRDDGFESPESYRPVTQPGVYVPTTIPAMPQWPMRKTWFLESAAQFRPGPPPALDSALWARDYNEIKALGANNGSTRTAEQTQIAKFWEATLPSIYHGLVRSVAERPGRDLTQNARLFAAVAQGMDDALIAVFDAKYHYNFWRPVTAIRNGDSDRNDATERDASWTPLIDNPLHPEYPSAHSILAGAVAAVLQAEIGAGATPALTTTSPSAKGVVRRWSNVDDFAQEVANARIYEGIHYRSSTEVGITMGRKIGTLAANQFLRAPDFAEVPGTLKPGADEALSMVVPARGVQIYECRAAKDMSSEYEWAFVAPEAALFDTAGKRIGRHYAGPHWEAADGSKFVGTVKARTDAPVNGAIPWLLLAAKPVASEGAFGNVTSVQRVNTVGGQAPASGCSQATVGSRARVDYTADYYFFTATQSLARVD